MIRAATTEASCEPLGYRESMPNPSVGGPDLPDGLVAVVKRDCPTCTLVAPVLAELGPAPPPADRLHPGRPDVPRRRRRRVDDTRPRRVARPRHRHRADAAARRRRRARSNAIVGWSREQWEALHRRRRARRRTCPTTGPGCGSRTRRPGRRRRARACASAAPSLHSAPGRARRRWRTRPRRCSTGAGPTGCRSCRRPRRGCCACSTGTTRAPDEVVAVVPPDLVECTVEKVAINAVMAGCRPEYLPVVLAAVEAACTDEFNMPRPAGHDVVLAARSSIVNGPIAARHRHELAASTRSARATGPTPPSAGRCSSSIRNVGGGRPGEVDRATLGNPGKYTFCFAEDEDGLAVGAAVGRAGHRAGHDRRSRCSPARAPRGVVDQLSRTPESLARSFAAVPAHGRPPEAGDRLRRHARGVARARARVRARRAGPRPGCARSSTSCCSSPGARARARRRRHRRGPARGASPTPTLPKFRAGGLLIVHAGGGAGLFSAIIGGWASGAIGSEPVTREVGHDVSRRRARPDRRAHARSTASRVRAARRRSTGRTVGLLDITKPRGDVFLDRLERAAAPSAGLTVERYRQADVHQAGARRPAPRDRHEVRRGDRGPRRLRLVHVVQCARHRRPRSAGACRACSSRRPSSSRPPPRRPRRSASTPARVFVAPPDPGPHRRRDARPGRRRRRRDRGRSDVLA